MRLKVSRDKPRASDIVELASRRCIVGSAPSCDVRVDEPGVAPITCLIFHGSKNNVVRWLDAPREFAGGELFQDEVLCAGDPLQIGPVELELLIDEIMATEELAQIEEMPGASEDRLAEYILRLERLEIQLVELQQTSEATASSSGAENSNREVAASISDLSIQLAILQSRSATDRDLWAGERAELEALLQSRLREFDVLQDEVHRLRDELLTVRGEYGSLAANHDARERLPEVSQALAERTEAFEQERTSWVRDRGEFQRALQQHLERFEQFETQLAQQSTRQAESEAARQAAEARADRLQESVEKLSQRLAEQQGDYESVRAAWEADRVSLESQLAEAKQQLAQSAVAESAGPELHDTWDFERIEQRADRGISVAPGNPMDRLLAESALVHAGDDEADEPVLDFASATSMTRVEVATDYPEDCYSDDEYGSSDSQGSNYYERAFSGLQSTAYLNDETESASDEGEVVSFAPAPSAPPVSTADVLARLGQSGLWSNDTTDAEPAFEQPQYTPVRETPLAASIAKATSVSDDDEESIEAYMARLMNRVRGTDERDEPVQRVQPTTERSPVTEYTEVANAPQPDYEPESEKFNPEEYKPRSQAPELADRMTAMRSLANDSARTAIASHAKRNWSSVMQLKLLVSVFAFVSVLVSIVFFWDEPFLMGLGTLVGVGVLVYWARNAITYRKLLLDSLMLEPEGGDHDDSPRDEDTA